MTVCTRVMHGPYATEFAGCHKVKVVESNFTVGTLLTSQVAIGNGLEPCITPEHNHTYRMDGRVFFPLTLNSSNSLIELLVGCLDIPLL